MSRRIAIGQLPPELRKAARAARRREAEEERERFRESCARVGLPRPVPEVAFAKESHGRVWRFDFAFEEERVALEVEGASFGTGPACVTCGQRQAGRHTRGASYRKDLEKYNAAAVLGWRIIRVPPEDLYADSTFETIRAALNT